MRGEMSTKETSAPSSRCIRSASSPGPPPTSRTLSAAIRRASARGRRAHAGPRPPRTGSGAPAGCPRARTARSPSPPAAPSWHAGLAGKFMIERLARLPVDVDYASEYRYRDPIADPTRHRPRSSPSPAKPPTPSPPSAKLIAKGSKTLAICNVVGSAITREAAGHHHHQRRPRDRRRLHQGLHRPAHRLFLLALHLAQVRGTITAEQSSHSSTSSPNSPQARRGPPHRRRPQCASLASTSPPPTTSSSSAAASTTPSPSKARSSSRRSPTSTPKATPPAR